MSARLPTHLRVSAVLRRANDSGGMGMVHASGDAQAGGLLVILAENGRFRGMRERALDFDGNATLRPVGPASGDMGSVDDYWRDRTARDPDLWVIELDISHPERFAAATILDD